MEKKQAMYAINASCSSCMKKKSDIFLIKGIQNPNFSESRFVFAGCNPWHVIGSSCHYR